MSKLHHPDVNPNDGEAAQKFLDISEAYNVLGNDFTRCGSTFLLHPFINTFEFCSRVFLGAIVAHAMTQARSLVIVSPKENFGALFSMNTTAAHIANVTSSLFS